MKTSVFIATSLDGFIARPDGRLDWLPGADGDGGGSGEDHGYRAFMADIDVIVMGRLTFETVLDFGAWPYGALPVVVLSGRQVSIPAHLAASVASMSGPPAEIVERLVARGSRHAYVDGGRTIQGFLAAGLVSRLIVTRVPILIGGGVPLFGSLGKDIRLRHVRTQAYASGLVQSEYAIAAEPR
jgi:dihydrofolate reductase